MNKRGELSRVAVNLLIASLILILAVISFFIVKNILNNQHQEVFDDSTLDLKISQVQKVDDSTLNVTVKRNEGEGEFVALSFVVDDGITTEVIRKNTSLDEFENESISLDFFIINASKIKKISVTPIYINQSGKEVIGNVKDEYVTPNTCSNYCPTGAQCGLNGCGMKCGSGCNNGYFCLNYKCIKESSGGGGGGGSDDDDDTNPTCTDTCSSLVYQCGTQTICGSSMSCGTCTTGYVCSSGLCVQNTTCVPTTCSALSRTCGTASNGCGGTLTCGTCSTGYTCQTNGTCIKDVVVACNGVSCKSGEYCSNGACLLNVSGHTYFVAVNGNDAWSGNFTHPWKTWGKAFHSAHPGDIVYFRGGTYYTEVTDGRGIRYIPGSGLGYDGNSTHWIRYFNYPGEIPILDCAESTATYDDVYNYGLYLYGVDYVHIKGLKIKNVKQEPSPLGVQADVCMGLCNYFSNHLKLENMEIYNIDGYAFRTITPYYAEIINCDAHDNCDYYHSAMIGNWGGGFGGGNSMFSDGYLYYYGCRAWHNSDQSFCGSGSISQIVFENCWSFDNGPQSAYNSNGDAIGGGGIGFKLGYWSSVPTIDPVILVKNCIAANNPGAGFTGNENDQTYAAAYHIYNNVAYRNRCHGFTVRNTADTDEDEYKRVLRNNIAYSNALNGNPPYFDFYNQGYSYYTASNNTWDSSVTVTDADFVSLNVSQLYAPRKADGSLPDITFGHLKAGSDLIDKGINVGLNYSGSAPDLGAFEYVSTCIPTTCSALSRTCGTASNGCGGTLTCGTCSTGYACQTNGTCIKDVVVTCNGVSCGNGEYCSNGVCLLNVTGKTYFVATNGNDAWSGTFEQPWKTWGKALNSPSVNPGDIVYFRGGIYMKNLSEGADSSYFLNDRQAYGSGYQISRIGTPGNPIRYFNYPGEKPILDCSNVIPPSGNSHYGIRDGNADYTHLKGLTIRNVFQTSGVITEVAGFLGSGKNMIIENCAFYNTGGSGLSLYGGDNVSVINCDAYNCSDPFGDPALPGNDGYGFQITNPGDNTSKVYYTGCRAWNNGDDGFSFFDSGYTEVNNCWSFNNGQLEGAGNGYKLGFLPDNRSYAELTRKVTNSIAAYNRASGFTSNDNNNEAVSMQLYNNLVYHNGYSSGYPGISPGFYLYNTIYSDAEELKRVLKNNLAYANEDGPVRIAEGALYTHDHNSWDISVNVSNEDFVLLPETQEQGFAILSAPRKADGSLPDLGNYFKLAPGSDLIDKGVNVGLSYSGSAPDLGAFETS